MKKGKNIQTVTWGNLNSWRKWLILTNAILIYMAINADGLRFKLICGEGYSREKARKPYSLLWGGMASGGLGAPAPSMAFSLESPLDISHGQAHEIK